MSDTEYAALEFCRTHEWQPAAAIPVLPLFAEIARLRTELADLRIHSEGQQADLLLTIKQCREAEKALATARAEEAEAWPKTADGVPLKVGLVVECPNGHDYTYSLHDRMSGRLYCCRGKCWSDGCQGDFGSGTHYEITDCRARHPKEQAHD